MFEPKLKLMPSGVWHVYWNDGKRTQSRSSHCRDHADALEYLARWLRDRAGADITTVAALWKKYRSGVLRHTPATVTTFDSAWRRLGPHFGALQPSAITQDTVDGYVDERAYGRIGRVAQSGSIRKELAALMACLNWCANPRQRLIDKVDVPDVELPDPSERRDRWLRTDETQRLLHAARLLRPDNRLSRAERFIWLALETGARKSAIQELTWDRVDLATGTIEYAVPGRRQSSKRRISVPISRPLHAALHRAFAERTTAFVLDSTADIWRELKAATDRAGLDRVSPHTFRHTAATHMARNGVPLAHIADLLGNTVAVTERVYRHHHPDAVRAAVEKISCGGLAAAE